MIYPIRPVGAIYKAISLLCLSVLMGCGNFPSAQVSGRDIPTAYFVFFEKGSATPVAGSEKVVTDLSHFMKAYGDMNVDIIGHIAKDETEVAGLDIARASAVRIMLLGKGLPVTRMRIAGKALTESVSDQVGGDLFADRRVDIMVVVLPQVAMGPAPAQN